MKNATAARLNAAGLSPGGIAETVVNPLPRERTRTSLHYLDGYYALRNPSWISW